MPGCQFLSPRAGQLHLAVLSGSTVNPSFPSTRTAPAFPPLEITGAQPLSCGELISRPQDCLVRVRAFVPNQLIAPGIAEAMLREEPIRPESVVLTYGAQHLSTGHAVPCHHLFTPLSQGLNVMLELHHIHGRMPGTKAFRLSLA